MDENLQQGGAERRELLLHPIRLRIVQELVGQPMTPQQLKARLGDVPQATLYRQINRLADGGLIQVTRERPIRGGVERTYAVVADAVTLTSEALRDATESDHFRYFATFAGSLLAQFAAYLESVARPDFAADRVGYRQVPLWLTDEEFDVVAQEVNRVMVEALGNEPSPGRRRRLFTSIVMPDASGRRSDPDAE